MDDACIDEDAQMPPAHAGYANELPDSVSATPLLAQPASQPPCGDPQAKQTLSAGSEYIPELLNRVLALVRSGAIPELAELGLSVPAARTLVLLLRRGPMRASDLAELAGIDVGRLSHLMRTLDRRGAIHRARRTDDARTVMVGLLPEGVALARSCDGMYRRSESQMIRGIPEAEVTELRLTLQALLDRAAAGKARDRRERGR